MLEKHLDVPLFDRLHRGVRLNHRGWAYLKEMQRILAEVHGVSERQRRWPRRLDPPDRRDFDAWLAYTGETAAPRPVTRREDTLLEETLYEEQLLPVCSPALLAARGQPGKPAGLSGWPLALRHGLECGLGLLVRPPGPDHAGPVAGLWLPPQQHAGPGGSDRARRRHRTPERCCLITTAAARQRPEVRAFRAWILDEARAATRAGADA